MEDMPWGLKAFAHYICLTLDYWGYKFDGSKVNNAIDKMLEEMTEEDIRNLVDFVDDCHQGYDDEGVAQINYDQVGFYLDESKYALGFVMMISEEYAVNHFDNQLREMNYE